MALLPDGAPFSINAVNPGSYSELYVRNRQSDTLAGNLSTEYDGLTVLMTTTDIVVQREQELFIQVAIAGAPERGVPPSAVGHCV